jgi:hypothetical protein
VVRTAAAAPGQVGRRRGCTAGLGAGGCSDETRPGEPGGGAGWPPPAAALEAFAGNWESRCPAIINLWRAHWSGFTPFLAFPPEVRRVIYTTNPIIIFSFRVSRGCGLRRSVVDSVVDGTLAA